VNFAGLNAGPRLFAVSPFDELKHRFWDPSVDFQVEVPLQESALRAVEAKLVVTLPAEYVELVRIQNGGYLMDDLRTFRSPAADDVEFRAMRGIGPEGLLENAYLTEEWEMPPELVLLEGDGHTWVALDYRRDRVPSVTWYDNELEQDIPLAPDFRTFLEGLGPDPDAPPVDPFDARPHEPAWLYTASSIATKIKMLRDDLARYERGERSLQATRAWLAARPSEVIHELPRLRTRTLRAAAKRVERAQPEELPTAVEATIAALEPLIENWCKRPRAAGRWLDEAYLRYRR
jgi:hypothetical protein